MRMYDYRETTTNVYMVFEYCNGGTLKEYIKNTLIDP